MKFIQDENLSQRYSHFNIDPAERDVIQHHCHAMESGRPVCRSLPLIEMLSREQR